MIDIHPLYSSSSGNMFHIGTNKTDILVDAGVNYKSITNALSGIDKNINDISAVLITHEHTDHIKGLPLLCRNNNIPIFACGKTADYIKDMLDEKNISSNIFKISYGQPFQIHDIDITAFETSHDALMPCGFRLKSDTTTLAYATDLGYVSNEVFENLQNADFVVLESNYDETMLDFGRYPYPLKRRIKCNLGHLSNLDSAQTVARLLKENDCNFVLAHLSENNNTPDIARSTFEDILTANDIDFNNANISFASKNLTTEVFKV
ncbi:MAG: MBL fold metallo-hydrolase [Clostridia bacterium]|nr:MBL fold metallo-hydrolase [Clostridia bacterium]